MKNNKFKELLKDKKIIASVAIVVGLIILGILQLVFKF